MVKSRTKREYATTAEVAMKLGVSTVSVRKYAASGKIPAYRVGGLWRFDPEEVLLFCAAEAQKKQKEGA